MLSKGIKQCPICGRWPRFELVENPYDDIAVYNIRCGGNCYIFPNRSFKDTNYVLEGPYTVQDAIKKWNEVVDNYAE